MISSNVIIFNIIALSSKWDSLLQLVGVSILFIIILAITFLTTKFVGGVKLQNDKKSNFKVIETYKIANNKFLQLIKVGEKYIVISVAKDTMQFITELKEDEVAILENKMMPTYDFADILDKFKLKQKEKNNQKSDN